MTENRKIIQDFYLKDENIAFAHIEQQQGQIQRDFAEAEKIGRQFIRGIRQSSQKNMFDAFWQEYSLSGEEGLRLMSLAEAMLRTPDKYNQYALIMDKINHNSWKNHLWKSSSLGVNAASLGLFVTHKFLQLAPEQKNSYIDHIKDLSTKIFYPAIRLGVKQVMVMMGKQFVLAQNIKKAMKYVQKQKKHSWRYSFDMLGEGARSQKDAHSYYQTYLQAIRFIGAQACPDGDIAENHGVSVKISAIYPRFEHKQKEQALPEILALLIPLCLLAKDYNIGLNIDAEEADRLELTLDIVKALLHSKDLKGWNGLGFVVQSYQKRSPFVIDWLYEIAKKNNRKMMIRLVKGAYWDSEIKNYQAIGTQSYPVWTRKETTDAVYLLCAQKLIDKADVFFPQFATHNAATAAQIITMLKGKDVDCEFQRLHGMGEKLHQQIVRDHHMASRVYAPVGSYDHLLSYLIRRLLENSANSSFVHLVSNPDISVEALLQNPFELLKTHPCIANEKIALPPHIYGEQRLNAKGYDLNDDRILTEINHHIKEPLHLSAHSLIAENSHDDEKAALERQDAPLDVRAPFNYRLKLGEKSYISLEDIENTYKAAQQGLNDWQQSPLKMRADLLLKTADMIEENWLDYMNLCMYEAGKTRQDAVAEIREAVDFCRYYALQGLKISEENKARGVWVCISPWNFPLAIFIGQITAALMTGNSVIAKPAEQTSLIAYYTVQKMHGLGFPKNVLQLVLGEGNVGAALTKLHGLGGVAFTGSTEVAKRIQKSLSLHSPQAALIAETGGQNVMIIDSTALAEQVVDDVIASSFQSAGQRCSSARILCIQKEVYEPVVTLLKGAMAELKMTSPLNLHCDLSSVIDRRAQQSLQHYVKRNSKMFKLLYQLPLSNEHKRGYYVRPSLLEVRDLYHIKGEQFGPILHVKPFAVEDRAMLVRKIHHLGYGLTTGIHSRITDYQKELSQSLNVGNIYINRNQIGAIVGMQPFGGVGLSGTGPKAGGPSYLGRFTQVSLPKHPDLNYVFKEVGRSEATSKHVRPWEKDELICAITQWQKQIGYLSLSVEPQATLTQYLKAIKETWIPHFASEQQLPAITGEENILSHHPQGIVTIDNSQNDLGALLAIIAALCTGNKVLTLKPMLQKWYDFLHIRDDLPLDYLTDIHNQPMDMFLSSEKYLQKHRQKMAKRKEKVISVYAYDLLFYKQQEAWKLNGDIFAALTFEKTVSCDKARTIGNTDLMQL